MASSTPARRPDEYRQPTGTPTEPGCPVVAAFGARGIDREALASLLLFQQACAEESVTLEMIRRLVAELRKGRSEVG